MLSMLAGHKRYAHMTSQMRARRSQEVVTMRVPVRTVASMVARKGGDYTTGGCVPQLCDLVVGRGDRLTFHLRGLQKIYEERQLRWSRVWPPSSGANGGLGHKIYLAMNSTKAWPHTP
jgi:hypothetical protein